MVIYKRGWCNRIVVLNVRGGSRGRGTPGATEDGYVFLKSYNGIQNTICML
jgi:hypothetical protein